MRCWALPALALLLGGAGLASAGTAGRVVEVFAGSASKPAAEEAARVYEERTGQALVPPDRARPVGTGAAPDPQQDLGDGSQGGQFDERADHQGHGNERPLRQCHQGDGVLRARVMQHREAVSP